MKKAGFLILPLIIMPIIAFSSYAYAANKWERLIEESGKVLAEIQKMPDQNVPDELMSKCSAIAIFPNTVSAGIVLGGKYGQGIIMVRNEKTGKWQSPAIFTLVGGSVGWQLGGHATDFVLLFMNRRSVDGILQGQCKLGTDAAIAAGPVGRNAEASTDAQLKGEILSYSRSRGLFAGIILEGAVVTQHWNGNKELYGNRLSAEEIMIENKAKMPIFANRLLKILNKYPYRP